MKSCTHYFHSFRIVGLLYAQILDLKVPWEKFNGCKVVFDIIGKQKEDFEPQVYYY